MEITASMVKELRENTGAGMLDCKKALVECKGDMKKAKDYLREKGLAKAKSKANRIAAEGLCNFVSDKNIGYIYELNSETDFVAKNKEFLDCREEIGKVLIKSNAKNTEEALKLKAGKQTVEELIASLTAKIGEKITLRRVTRIEKTAKEYFGYYAHQQGRIVNVCIIDQNNPEVGKNIGMQLAASNAEFLNENEVPKERVASEKEIIKKQIMQEGKPEQIALKIVEGRIKKYFAEICLLDQPYVKEPKQSVRQYLEQNKVNVLRFFRLEVGEGIEKKQEDFAAEVMAQVKK